MNRDCNGRYIIVDGKITPEPDLIKWAMWFEVAENRVVKQDWVEETFVSTIFLGLDHNFEGGAPILWETMAFNGPMNSQMDRCSGNREQAEAMHAAMVAKVEKGRASNLTRR